MEERGGEWEVKPSDLINELQRCNDVIRWRVAVCACLCIHVCLLCCISTYIDCRQLAYSLPVMMLNAITMKECGKCFHPSIFRSMEVARCTHLTDAALANVCVLFGIATPLPNDYVHYCDCQLLCEGLPPNTDSQPRSSWCLTLVSVYGHMHWTKKWLYYV